MNTLPSEELLSLARLLGAYSYVPLSVNDKIYTAFEADG